MRQVWEYAGNRQDRFFSPFYCEADLLSQTGNILVTDGGRIEDEQGNPKHSIPSDHQWARIFEITRGEPVERVFEVIIDSGLGQDRGWSIYRSERFPTVEQMSHFATVDRRSHDHTK